MTRRKETLRIIIIILILLILLVVSEILRKDWNTGQEKETTAVSSDTIRIDLGGGVMKDYTLPSIPEGGTMEFSVASYFVEDSLRRNETSEEYVSRWIEKNEQSGKLYFEEERLNADGSITVVLNQTQYDRRIEDIKKSLDELHASAKLRIEISEDLTHATYYVEDDCTLDEWVWICAQCSFLLMNIRVLYSWIQIFILALP